MANEYHFYYEVDNSSDLDAECLGGRFDNCTLPTGEILIERHGNDNESAIEDLRAFEFDVTVNESGFCVNCARTDCKTYLIVTRNSSRT